MNSIKNEFNDNTEIKIDLSKTSSSKEELEEFINIFEKIGKTKGERHTGGAGPTFPIGIEFLVSAAVTIFFTAYLSTFGNKLASDHYDFFKTKFNQLLLKRIENKDTNGYLCLKYDDSELDLDCYYACYYLSKDDIENFIYSMWSLDSLLRKARKFNNVPFDNKCDNYSIFMEFGRQSQDHVFIEVRRRKTKDKLIIYNEICNTNVKLKDINKLKWDDMEWDYKKWMTDEDDFMEFIMKELQNFSSENQINNKTNYTHPSQNKKF